MPPYVKRPYGRRPTRSGTKSHFLLRDGLNGQGGRNEEQWVGSNLAACMLIHTKAVLSNRRRCEPPSGLEFIHGIFVESVTWVTEGFL